MRSQALFTALSLAIICAVSATNRNAIVTTQVQTTTSYNSFNSTQVVPDGNLDDIQDSDESTDSTQPISNSRMADNWNSDPDDSERQSGRQFDDGSADMNQTPSGRNSTSLDQPSFENSSSPVQCLGPLDPNTGEGVLDSNSSCSIVCYNNLILNDAGDACVCPPTFQFDPVQVKCVCRSPFVQRGAKCVLLPSQAAAARHGSNKKRSLNEQMPLGFDNDMLHGKYRRSEVDRIHCPSNEIACRMKSGGFECLDPDVTLDSCGGCTSMGTGVDCRNIPGAGDVGCNAGVCVVINCQEGFKLVNGGCSPKHHR